MLSASTVWLVETVVLLNTLTAYTGLIETQMVAALKIVYK